MKKADGCSAVSVAGRAILVPVAGDSPVLAVAVRALVGALAPVVLVAVSRHSPTVRAGIAAAHAAHQRWQEVLLLIDRIVVRSRLVAWEWGEEGAVRREAVRGVAWG